MSRVAQILKRHWDAPASITVVELVRGCGDFKVVEPSTLQDSNNDPHLPNMPLNAGQPNTIYIVNQSCSGVPAVFGKMCSTCVGMVVWFFGSERKKSSSMSSRIWYITTTNMCTTDVQKQHLSSMH